MKCIACGASAVKGLTTSVSDLGNCLIIVRNVPCYKCVECSVSILRVLNSKLAKIQVNRWTKNNR